MTREIGVNHSRFISKLYNSITLSFRDVNRFTYYVNFGPKLMFSQVAKEIEEDKELESKLKEFKSIGDMVWYDKKLGQKTSSLSNTKRAKRFLIK